MLFLVRSVQWVGSFLLVCMAAASFVQNPRNVQPPLLRDLLELMRDWRSPLMVATAACVLFAQFSLSVMENRERNRKVIRAIVDALHAEYFAAVRASKKHEHRVTLFRRKRLWRTCLWGQYLVVYIRSGTHPRSGARFRVDDNMARCEGFAGRIWYIDATLPPVIVPPWSNDAADAAGRQAYADAGNVTIDQARRLNLKSRSFTGTIIRIGGDRWGVLLVDSLLTVHVTNDKNLILQRYAALLEKVL